MNIFSKISRKAKLIVATAIVAVGLTTAATVAFAPETAYAAGCDKVNIIHCGLDGNSHSEYVKSLQKTIDKGSSNGHGDIKAVMAWAGAGSTDMKTLSTSNTEMGTMYRNGDVKVDGKVVATDAWVSARFTEGKGFVKVKDGVWARKTTTSLAHNSYKAVVHYDGNGEVDFVVLVDCGNAVKVKPVQKPKPVLKCSSLKWAATGDMRTFSFTARASASNTKISSYTVKYSDGHTETIRTTATAATFRHQFAGYGKTYTATLYVTGTHDSNLTAAACKVTVTTPAAPVNPALVCNSLTAVAVPGEALTYKFVARATPVKTTITDYVFTYGDGKSDSVKTSALTATSTHAYTEHGKTYTAYVTVSSTHIKKAASTNCVYTFTTPKVEECKPGIPVGDARCTEVEECVPTATQDEDCVELVKEEVEECLDEEGNACEELPEEMPDAGPGAIAALFAGTSALGAIGHRVFKKRSARI